MQCFLSFLFLCIAFGRLASCHQGKSESNSNISSDSEDSIQTSLGSNGASSNTHYTVANSAVYPEGESSNSLLFEGDISSIDDSFGSEFGVQERSSPTSSIHSALSQIINYSVASNSVNDELELYSASQESHESVISSPDHAPTSTNISLQSRECYSIDESTNCDENFSPEIDENPAFGQSQNTSSIVSNLGTSSSSSNFISESKSMDSKEPYMRYGCICPESPIFPDFRESSQTTHTKANSLDLLNSAVSSKVSNSVRFSQIFESSDDEGSLMANHMNEGKNEISSLSNSSNDSEETSLYSSVKSTTPANESSSEIKIDSFNDSTNSHISQQNMVSTTRLEERQPSFDSSNLLGGIALTQGSENVQSQTSSGIPAAGSNVTHEQENWDLEDSWIPNEVSRPSEYTVEHSRLITESYESHLSAHRTKLISQIPDTEREFIQFRFLNNLNLHRALKNAVSLYLTYKIESMHSESHRNVIRYLASLSEGEVGTLVFKELAVSPSTHNIHSLQELISITSISPNKIDVVSSAARVGSIFLDSLLELQGSTIHMGGGALMRLALRQRVGGNLIMSRILKRYKNDRLANLMPSRLSFMLFGLRELVSIMRGPDRDSLSEDAAAILVKTLRGDMDMSFEIRL
jgi:hypothetical protein